MPIKRFTVEFDDSLPDTTLGTSPPLSLKTKKKKTRLPSREITSTPADKEEDYEVVEAEQPPDISVRPEPVGRTPSDLMFIFIDSPRVMVVALTVISFLIFSFSNKITKLTDFWIPLSIAAVLNTLWFVFGWIKKK